MLWKTGDKIYTEVVEMRNGRSLWHCEIKEGPKEKPIESWWEVCESSSNPGGWYKYHNFREALEAFNEDNPIN